MTTQTPVNALARGLGVLGDEWSMLIIQRALLGDRRYGQFRHALPISDAVLTARLTDLVALDLLRPTTTPATASTDAEHRIGYDLTVRGRGLWPVHLLIWNWERTWSPSHDLPAIHHQGCGANTIPTLSCASCQGVVAPSDITAEWGPAGGWHRSVPRGGRRRRGSTRGPGQFPETMSVVGNHWSLAVLVAALWGTRRFGDFATTLSVSPAVLSERLRALVDGGLLQPRPSVARADWLDYHPTPKAVGLLPIFAVMVTWAERWFGATSGPSVILRHQTCGLDLSPVLCCNRCRATLLATDIAVAPFSDGPTRGSPQPSQSAHTPAYSVH